MKISCRACHSLIPDHTLLSYTNMPKSAQFFPNKEDLETELGIDILLYQCPYCGLVQAAGDPVSYYRDVIRASGVSEEMRDFRMRQYQNWVQKYDLSGKKILEIGCGVGEYMDMMETAPVQVYGLEHRSESVKVGCANGHQIIEGFIDNEETAIYGAPYDGFYSMNFLEHIPNPAVFLRGIVRNLSEAAIGLVEVPNFDMILQKSLYSEFIQDHLSYFTKQTLCALLEQNGFEVLSCEAIWHRYILSAVVKKRKQIPLDGFLEKREQLKSQIDIFLQQQEASGKKVAVWGAGHQALANLSLLEMKNRILYVVDSAPFKQNRYTPATHIPIVAPDRLICGEVQTIIIMAAGYSQEVKRIMEKQYPEITCVIMGEDGLEMV